MAMHTDYQRLGLPSSSPFDWQVSAVDAKERQQARRDYLRKLTARRLTDAQVLKNKATRRNLPINLRAYTEPTNSERAAR